MTNYNQLPIAFARGEGAYLWDTAGNVYLDALGGIAVCALGHAHPSVTRAIQQQAQTLLHVSNLYTIPEQLALAEKLCQLSGMQSAFFCNSGAEANEAALKLARLFGHSKNIAEPKVLVMEKAFHGRTLATLSATGNKKAHQGFEPLVPGFVRVPYNDLGAVEKALSEDPSIVAVLVEPIQGEGGIAVPDEAYLPGLRQLCDTYNCLLSLDEVQTGMGRTGKFLAYQHYNITPDIVTLAKALGNGIPIGACLAQGKAASLFQPGSHGSTFGGNPFAATIALTVLDTLEQEKLIARAAHTGKLLLSELHTRLHNHPHVKAIRGKGLMIGIELDKPCRDILMLGLKHGILFNVTAESVIRLLPPYILTDEQIIHVATLVTACINDYYA
jgi:acetylornithine aminotransferase